MCKLQKRTAVLRERIDHDKVRAMPLRQYEANDFSSIKQDINVAKTEILYLLQ